MASRPRAAGASAKACRTTSRTGAGASSRFIGMPYPSRMVPTQFASSRPSRRLLVTVPIATTGRAVAEGVGRVAGV